MLTAASMAGYLGGRTLLPAGPGVPELLTETERRTGGGDARHHGEAAVENFAGVRVDLSYDDALGQARRFAPDPLVCEVFDFVGPMVAAALDLPWAAHAASDAGAGVVIEDRAEAGAAVRTVLTEPRYRQAAQAAAAAIRTMPTPEVVLDDLLARAGRSALT